MPQQTGRLITDDALDQLARRWLADAWVEQPKAFESKSREDVASYGTLLDWLLDTDNDAAVGGKRTYEVTAPDRCDEPHGSAAPLARERATV